ncbi:PIR Superfamily Protein [Plasmodium ovale wallikeri]|uniref:PIR Superfamily Protein n=1 Tax=Plasmodium ovale wallikeri TaxID=864142 RepID=A0A1A9AD83_PLAOA|nr:PIR Superfamily Protein [Plasmodium ovale wallikeri]
MDDDNGNCEYKEADYDFFNDLHKYIKYESEAESHADSENYGNFCKFDKVNYQEISNSLNSVCKKFKYLLDTFVTNTKGNIYNIKHVGAFLNYWLNKQLRSIKNNTLCVKVFHQNIQTFDAVNNELRNLRGHIYDISGEELKNMYLLHSLQSKYDEAHGIINSEHSNKKVCIHLTEECASDCKNAEETYSNKNKKFCEAFKSFKSKYEKLNFCTESLNGSEKIEFRTLSDSYQILENDCEISLYTKNSEQPEEVRKPPDTVTDTPSMNKQNIVIPVVSVLESSDMFSDNSASYISYQPI